MIRRQAHSLRHAGPPWLALTLTVFWGGLLVTQLLDHSSFSRADKIWVLSAEDLKGVNTLRMTQRGVDFYRSNSIDLEFDTNGEVVIDAQGLLKDFDQIMPVKVVRMGEVLAIHLDWDQFNENERQQRRWDKRFRIERIRLPSSIQHLQSVENLDLNLPFKSVMPALTVSSCTVNLKGNGQIDRLTVSDWAACPQESGSISLDVKVNQHLHMITHARSVELKGASLNAKQVDLKLKADNIKLSVDSLRPWMNSQKQGEAAAWKLVEIQAGDSPQFPMETAENPSAQAVVIRPQWTSEQPPAIPIKR